MSATTDAAPPARKVPGRTLAGVLLMMFLVSIDSTIIGPALPTIGATLGGVDLLPWTVTAFLLAATATTPLYGKLSDLYGRRLTVFASIGIFLAGSVLCALADSVLMLALARLLQGLGGGGLSTLANAVIGDSVPPRERGKYQGVTSGAYTAGAVVGPVIGGALAEYAHWSLIFWVNVPFCLIAYALLQGTLPRSTGRRSEHPLDVSGALVLAAATCTLMFALSWAGVRYAWTSVPILGLIAATIALGGWFTVHARRAPDPLLPLGMLSNRVIAPAAATALLVMSANIGLTIYLPVYFQLVSGMSPSASGAALLVMMAATMIGSVIVGVALHRTGLVVRLTYALLAAAMIASLVLALAAVPALVVVLLMAPLGFAIGAIYPFTSIAAQNAAEHRHLGVVLGLVNWTRTIGAAAGGALFGALVLGAGGGHLELLAAGGVPASAELVAAYRDVFLLTAGAFAAAILCIAFMEHRPLRTTH